MRWPLAKNPEPGQVPGLVRDGGVDADGKQTRVGEPSERRDFLRRIMGGILHLGEPDLCAGLCRHQDLPLEIRERGAGHDRLNEIHGAIDENPGGRSVRAPHDPSALRISRRAADRSGLERGRVDPDGMPVHAARDHGAVRKDDVQVAGVWELFSRPAVLVPATSLRPIARGQAGGDRPDSPGRFAGTGRAAQIRDLQGLPKTRQMTVRVRPAGEDEAPGQIHARRAGCHPPGADSVADEGDLPVPYEDVVLLRPGIGGDVDHRPLEDQTRIRNDARRGGEKRQDNPGKDHSGILDRTMVGRRKT